MKKTIKIAIIAGIVFALTVFLFLEGQTQTRQVVVAAQDIAVGTIVSAGMLRTERIPVAAFQVTGLAGTKEDIVGQTVTIGRVAGDLVPLAAVGRERKLPHPGNGFLTITVPMQEAAGVIVGDEVAIAVFGMDVSRLLDGFTVVGLSNAERDVHLVLEADGALLLDIVPFLSTRSFKVVRR